MTNRNIPNPNPAPAAAGHNLLWRRPHDGRFYRALLQRDLLGDWSLVRTWGSTERKAQVLRTTVGDYRAGVALLQRLARERAGRGYRLQDHNAEGLLHARG